MYPTHRCMDTSYTFNESFMHDTNFDGFSLSLYEPCEFYCTRDSI